MPDFALSVVVIGRNEGERLIQCLESVRAMSHPFGPFEVIYVDSASTDGSPGRAASYADTVIEIKAGRLSAARARNIGWERSVAPFILFLDGDTILHPEFATRGLAEFENRLVMVVWGHRREIHPHASIYNRVLDLNWVYPAGLTEFCGGDAVMRRTALAEAGGFNANLIAGEEPDLCRRIRARGGLISHIDVPMTGHDFGMVSWRQYWKHGIRAGHAYAEIAALYRNTDDPLWSETARSNAVRASIYLLTSVLTILGFVLTHSWLFLLLPLLAGTAVILRTALRSRSKPATAGTLILFAIHSHVQQIPVFIGQNRYWVNRRRNLRSQLIEYKKT